MKRTVAKRRRMKGYPSSYLRQYQHHYHYQQHTLPVPFLLEEVLPCVVSLFSLLPCQQAAANNNLLPTHKYLYKYLTDGTYLESIGEIGKHFFLRCYANMLATDKMLLLFSCSCPPLLAVHVSISIKLTCTKRSGNPREAGTKE